MIALALGVGLAWTQDFDCSDGREAWLTELVSRGSRRAYTCLAGDGTASEVLIARAAEAEESARLTRALAVWRLQRLDHEIPDPEARAYGPADRRLLQDGVKAHRGRRSPAPDHLEVLEGQSWYQPDDRYTDARLTPVDRHNLAVLTDPPAPPPPRVEAPPPPPTATSRCGCASTAGTGGWLWGVLALGLSGRRRWRPAGPSASGAPRRAAQPPGA